MTEIGDAVYRAIDIALKDGVTGSQDNLDVRYNIIPDLDLLDENKNPISKRGWIQPVNVAYSTAEQDTLVYGGIQNQQQKVIVLTGIRALQSTVYAVSLRLDQGVGTIAIEDIQDLVSVSGDEAVRRKDFEHPYIYDTRVALKLYLRPNADGVGKQDKLLFEGVVVEPIGVNRA